jgi:hypothetical protein
MAMGDGNLVLVDGHAETLTKRIDLALIAQGYPEECVTWVCDGHRRHCNRIGTDHEVHACFWCDHA